MSKETGYTSIRTARERAGLTQERAADEAGLHRVYWSEVERGLRDCRLSVLTRFARGLGVPAYHLLAEAEGAAIPLIRDGRKGRRRPVR